MKYNTADTKEAQKAFAYLVELTAKKHVIELKKVVKKRSLSQNSYLHLLLGGFGQHFGYTLEEAKIIYKDLNAGIYKYDKEVRGKKHTFYRSSADLDTVEMTKSIDTLREWSARAGYPLPTATDQDWLRQIENEIERSNYYL